jgi:hypothetical protein
MSDIVSSINGKSTRLEESESWNSNTLILLHSTQPMTIKLQFINQYILHNVILADEALFHLFLPSMS